MTIITANSNIKVSFHSSHALSFHSVNFVNTSLNHLSVMVIVPSAASWCMERLQSSHSRTFSSLCSYDYFTLLTRLAPSFLLLCTFILGVCLVWLSLNLCEIYGNRPYIMSGRNSKYYQDLWSHSWIRRNILKHLGLYYWSTWFSVR